MLILQLKPGEFFMFSGSYYIRIDPIGEKELLAVNLESGYVTFPGKVGAETEVTPVDPPTFKHP